MKSPYATSMCPPELVPFLTAGNVFWDGDTLVGIAADGVEYALGSFGSWAPILSYLRSHPSPDTW